MLQPKSSIKSSVKKMCNHCSKEFYNDKAAKFCSADCRTLATKDRTIATMVARSRTKFPDGSDPDTYVECAICTYRTTDLSMHPTIHGIEQQDYRNKYGAIKCKRLRESMKGENNPAYGHGGKFSPFSKKFLHYKGDDYIEQLKKTAKQTIKDNNNNPLTLSYYMKDGSTEDQAKELLRDRQSTFSLEKCIEKYGEEAGRKRWNKRQEQWLNTLDKKTNQEKAEINRKKIYKNGMSSNQEKQLLELLKQKSNLDLQSQHIIKRIDEPNKHYAYDIVFKDKIIEYNGDLWHANPNKYKSNDIPNFPGNKKTSKEIWERDLNKKYLAEKSGYTVMVVWETEFKSDKQKVINECINFLTQ